MFTRLMYFPQSWRIAASRRQIRSRFPRPCTLLKLSKIVVVILSNVSERFLLTMYRLLMLNAQAMMSSSKSCSPRNILIFSAYS